MVRTSERHDRIKKVISILVLTPVQQGGSIPTRIERHAGFEAAYALDEIRRMAASAAYSRFEEEGL